MYPYGGLSGWCKGMYFYFMRWILAVKGLKLILNFFLKSNLTINLSSVLKERRMFTVFIEYAFPLQLCDSLISKLIYQSLVRWSQRYFPRTQCGLLTEPCVSVCVCMSVCVYAYECVCMCVCIWLCLCACVCVSIPVHIWSGVFRTWWYDRLTALIFPQVVPLIKACIQKT